MEPPLHQRRKPLSWVTSNLALKCLNFLSNWRSVSRYSLQNDLLLLQPFSHLLLLHHVPFLLQRQGSYGERVTGVDVISAAQWVWSYLEEIYRVPEWWREFQPLFQHPCDSATQNLACQQAVVFRIPAHRWGKMDGGSPNHAWKYWNGGKPSPKDFKGSHDY